MAYFDKALLDAAKNSSKKLVIEVGDTVTAKYLRYEVVEDEKFGGEKYQFEFLTEKGQKKFISTRAGKVLGKMARIIPGSRVQVTKLGEGQKTDFSFKVLSVPKQSSQVEQDEEVPEEELDTIQQEDEEDDDEEEILEAKF